MNQCALSWARLLCLSTLAWGLSVPLQAQTVSNGVVGQPAVGINAGQTLYSGVLPPIVLANTLTLTGSFPNGTVNTPYAGGALQAQGAASPLSFQVVGGDLPPGLTLNPTTGAAVGTPTQAGDFSFTAEVTDATSATGRAEFRISVLAGNGGGDGARIEPIPTLGTWGLIGLALAMGCVGRSRRKSAR